MIFWTTFIIGTFDQNTSLLVRKSKKFWENVRICEKTFRFGDGTYFSIMIFSVFFSDSNYLYEAFGHPIGPFFRCFVLYCSKLYFGMRSWDHLQKKNVSFWRWNLFSIMIFVFFVFNPNYLYELFGHPIRPFFRFFVLQYIAGNRIFLVSNIATFC